jgi:hypothetical protein
MAPGGERQYAPQPEGPDRQAELGVIVRRSITFAIRATAEPACHHFVDFIAIRSIDFLSVALSRSLKTAFSRRLFFRSEFNKFLFKDFDRLAALAARFRHGPKFATREKFLELTKRGTGVAIRLKRL